MSTVASQLASISSMHEVPQLQVLEQAMKSLLPDTMDDEDRIGLLRLFEKFPEDDGYGAFSSIISLLEKAGEYEPLLIDSVNRRATEFNLRMIARMLNARITNIGTTDLLSVLRRVAEDSESLKSAAEWAKIFISQAPSNGKDA